VREREKVGTVRNTNDKCDSNRFESVLLKRPPADLESRPAETDVKLKAQPAELWMSGREEEKRRR
jgi:hypothetical protein